MKTTSIKNIMQFFLITLQGISASSLSIDNNVVVINPIETKANEALSNLKDFIKQDYNPYNNNAVKCLVEDNTLLYEVNG